MRVRCKFPYADARAWLPARRCLQLRLRTWLCNSGGEGLTCRPRWWQLRLRSLIRSSECTGLSATQYGYPMVSQLPADLHGKMRCPICFRALRRCISRDAVRCPSNQCPANYTVLGLQLHELRRK